MARIADSDVMRYIDKIMAISGILILAGCASSDEVQMAHHTAMDINNPQNVFSIASHGGWDNQGNPSVFDSDGNPISPQKLADTLNQNNSGYSAGQTILLDSSNTGKGGANSFAAELANIMNTKVIAPDDFHWVEWRYTQGSNPENVTFVYSPTVGPSPTNHTGHFLQFSPGGGSTAVPYPSR